MLQLLVCMYSVGSLHSPCTLGIVHKRCTWRDQSYLIQSISTSCSIQEQGRGAVDTALV